MSLEIDAHASQSLLDREHGHRLGFQLQRQLAALSLRREGLRHDRVRRVEGVHAVNPGRCQRLTCRRLGSDAGDVYCPKPLVQSYALSVQDFQLLPTSGNARSAWR